MLLCCGKSYRYSSAVTTACACTWSLEALSISAARDWALVCVANRVLASYRLRLRIWPLSSSFCSLSFWFSWNTESGWEVEERDVGWEWDKYLDHTSVSGVMMIHRYLKKKKNKKQKWPLLKPHSTHTGKKKKHCTSSSSKQSIYFGNTYRTSHGLYVLQNKLLPCFVWCVMKAPWWSCLWVLTRGQSAFPLVLSWTISEGTAALTPMQFTLLHCD